MANDVTKQDDIPEWLKQRGAQVPSDDLEALSGLNNKLPRISLKGRKIRLIVDGEEIRKPRDEQDVVILGVEPEKGKMVKTYYEKGYQSGDSEPPTCSSADGVYPDPWIANPIHSNCKDCPKNQFGSATSQRGKPAKACKDSKRLRVVIPETDGDLPIGVEGTIFSLGVPVTSLNNLGEYGKELSKFGAPLSAVITKLSLEDSEFPILEFHRAGFLDQKQGEIAINRSIEKEWLIGAPTRNAALGNSTQKPNLISQQQAPSVDVDEVNQQAKAASKPTGNVDEVIGDWES